MDSLTLMTGLSRETEKIKLVSTIKLGLIHPVIAAKILATIDDVSAGRLLVNLVTGYNKDEFKQMGEIEKYNNWTDYRYDYAQEWIDIVKKLWTEDVVNYEGKFFNIKEAISYPKPVQKPYPELICAGISDQGMSFTVREADKSFIAGKNFSDVKLFSHKLKEIAKGHNKNTTTNTPILIIQGDTDEEAEEKVKYFEEGKDIQAMANAAGLYGEEAEGSNAKMILEQLKQSFFYGCLPLIGSPETIVETLEDLITDGGLDGLLFTFPDFIDGINEFSEKVIPLLKEKGYR